MPVGWEDYSTSSQPAYKSTNVPLLLLPLPFHYPWEQKTSITESSRVTTRQIENPHPLPLYSTNMDGHSGDNSGNESSRGSDRVPRGPGPWREQPGGGWSMRVNGSLPPGIYGSHVENGSFHGIQSSGAGGLRVGGSINFNSSGGHVGSQGSAHGRSRTGGERQTSERQGRQSGASDEDDSDDDHFDLQAAWRSHREHQRGHRRSSGRPAHTPLMESGASRINSHRNRRRRGATGGTRGGGHDSSDRAARPSSYHAGSGPDVAADDYVLGPGVFTHSGPEPLHVGRDLVVEGAWQSASGSADNEATSDGRRARNAAVLNSDFEDSK